MHILSPETDNCPSWLSGRERMAIENISWSISTKECCRPRGGWTRDLLVSSRTGLPTEPLRPALHICVIWPWTSLSTYKIIGYCRINWCFRKGPYWIGHAKQKCVLEDAQTAHIKIHPMHTQSHLGICFPLIHSILSNDFVRGQQRPWSDCIC